MAHERAGAAACVLPSGRVAVVGGCRAGNGHPPCKDGEVFDPVKREWKPLVAETTGKHDDASAVAVAGGLIVVGGMNGPGGNGPELYDEESGRWIRLPDTMAEPREGALVLVSVPAVALTAAA